MADGFGSRRNGQWHDGSLISATWVAESTTAYITEPEGWQGYRFLWWVPQKAWPFWRRSPGSVFFANGKGGRLYSAYQARLKTLNAAAFGDRAG